MSNKSMKDISDVTFCVPDGGLFLPIAFCLAEKAKRVIVWSPDKRQFPSLSQGIIGDGFEQIECTLDFWPMLKEIDCFAFPDIGQAGLQLHLESQCKAVWGSRDADSIELDREKFLDILKSTGLDVPTYRIFEGLSELAHHLENTEDVYIKISRWRGDLETTHWRNWKVDNGLLDCWACKFGPAKELIRFLVFNAIDTDLEIGGDTYGVDGKWPKVMLNGYEWKDKSYFGAVTKTKEMPEQIQAVLEAFGPVLAPYRYRNQWSMEVRVKDDKAYFIDPTCRGGLPSTASQMALWTNLPEIIWHGANGELIDPEYEDEFAMECVLSSKSDKHTWGVVDIPDELKPHVNLGSCCEIDGCSAFPPDDSHGDEIGWLVATGKTPKETLDTIKEYASMLPDGVSASTESLVNIIQEIETANEEGIEFSDKPLPSAEEVVT